VVVSKRSDGEEKAELKEKRNNAASEGNMNPRRISMNTETQKVI
jgi:hypothetical protein